MTTDLRQISMISIVLAGMSLGSGAAALDAGRTLRSPAPISENLKVPFIANQGQHDQSVRFYAGTFGGTVFVTDDGGIVYSLPCSAGSEAQGGVALREYLIGGQIDEITGSKPVSTAVSWFKGSDRSRWKSRLAAFEYIDLGEVYDGVNLRLRAYGNNVEKLFIVGPGGDVNQIRVGIDGAVGISVSGGGELEIMTELGEVMFTKPVAYQDYSGKREYVEVAYALTDTRYGFSVGDYDKDHQLVIDPLLASTYLGGSGTEGWQYSGAIDIASDNEGNIFMVGKTESDDFPLAGDSYDSTYYDEGDIFVAKLDADLSTLLAATYVGGGSAEEHPYIAIDEDGNVFICGHTLSNDFSVIPGSYDTTWAGQQDLFVSKFSNDLSSLLASTYLGGGNGEMFPMIAIDDSGSVFVSGQTTSEYDFPRTAEACQYNYGGSADFFVSKFSNDLTTLQASTFLGGVRSENWPQLGIDPDGNIILGGSTQSNDYPSTAGVYDDSFNGPSSGDFVHDAVITKLSNDLESILASTFIGTNLFDGGQSMAVDGAGNVVLGGHTESVNYPTTPGAYDPTHNGQNEYFITKMDNDLTDVTASTFLTANDEAWTYGVDLVCDESGNILQTGSVWGTGLTITHQAYDSYFNGGTTDAYLRRFSPDLTTMDYSTYFGGSDNEGGYSIILDTSGCVYVAGTTFSADFPLAGQPYDNDYNGGFTDAYVTKFMLDQFTRITEGPHVTDYDQSSGLSWIDINGDGYDDLYVTNVDPENRLYRNNGDGTFTRLGGDIVTCNTGDISSTSPCWSDMNNDGHPDVYITNYSESSPPANTAFINNGDETFTQLNNSAIVSVPSISFDASWADYNNDGLVDLYVTNFLGFNYLYRQDDTGFVPVTDPPIGSDAAASLATAWADYDSDGDMDLFVANAWGDRHDYLYDNNGDGGFTKRTTGVVTQAAYDSWGGSWGDYDNDGDQDLFVTSFVSGDIPSSYDYLYINNGDGTFTTDPSQVPCLVGAHTEGSAWGDYNNDGFLDLFVAVAGPNLLYRNQGDGTFIRITEGNIVTDDFVSRTGAWSDYDRDGDLDLYVANGDYLENSFYENNGNSNNWLVIECVGVESNRMAIGAKVRVKATVGGNPIYQMREISSRSGGSCQNSPSVHFGLADAVIIDSIKVEWPSGAIQVLTDVDVNQFLTIEEDCCSGLTGNVDYDPDDIVDIGDLTALIDYLFISYEEPACMDEANTDGVDHVDIGDLTALIDYLFISYTPPAECQ